VPQLAFGALLGTVAAIPVSISLGQGLAVLCLILWGLALVRRDVPFAVPASGRLAAVFVLLAATLSVACGGWGGGWSRAGELLWLLLLPATATLVREPARAGSVLRAFAIGGGVLAVKNALETPWEAWRDLRANVHPGFTYREYIQSLGSMTDGQMLMLTVVAGLALWLAARQAGRRAWPWAALAGLAGLALGLSLKRGSWVVAVALLAAFALLRRQWKAILALGVLVAAAALLPPVRARLSQAGGEFDVDGGGRLTMWFRAAPALVRENPLGMGYGCLTEERLQRAAPNVEKGRNHLHSNVTQVLVEEGWAGLALYAAWMAAALAAAARAVRHARAAGPAATLHAQAVLLMLFGLVLNGLVEYNLGDAELMVLLAVWMGLAGAWECGAGGRSPVAGRGTRPPARPESPPAGG
jgi:O-antigen ligase